MLLTEHKGSVFRRGKFDMFNKELKKLSRRELIDIIYQLKKNEQQMQAEIASLKEALEEKRIRLSEAGSVAEAALSVTNVFTAAQQSADLYLHEIVCMRDETEQECAKMIENANKAVLRIYSDCEKKHAELNARYDVDYKKLQQLKLEVQMLEQIKKYGSYEVLENGEES